MNGNNILITGANGMLGSQLVQEFPNSVGYASQDFNITNVSQIQKNHRDIFCIKCCKNGKCFLLCRKNR